MIFEVSKTSEWNRKPCEESYQIKGNYIDCRTCNMEEAKTHSWFKNWVETTINHIEKNGRIYGERIEKEELWIIDIDNIYEFINKHGKIIIDESDYKIEGMPDKLYSIEIYDDYRE